MNDIASVLARAIMRRRQESMLDESAESPRGFGGGGFGASSNEASERSEGDLPNGDWVTSPTPVNATSKWR
jgi:hypothetical protein